MDIGELTQSLDDLIDNLEQITSRLVIYGIPESKRTLKKFSNLIVKAVEKIHQCIELIRRNKMTSDDYSNAYLGISVSTTHTITSSIVGTGVARRFSSVRWGIAFDIVISWILTLPATIFLGRFFALLFAKL